jgi:hypothetical protein
MTRLRTSPLLAIVTAALASVAFAALVGRESAAGDGNPAGGKPADGKPADPAKPEPPKPAEPAKPDPAKPDPAKPEPPKPGDPANPDPKAAPAPAAVNPADIEKLKVHGRVCPYIAQPPAPREWVTVSDAQKELVSLKAYLKNKKADNQDIIASLTATAKAYHNLAPDTPVPEKPADAEPADPAAKKAWSDAKTAYEAAKAKLEADEKAFRRDANDLLLDALKVVIVKPNTSANTRDDVNIKAAEILAFCYPHEDKLTDWITKIMEDTIFKAKDYEPPTQLEDELFKTVAILNNKDKGFEEEFVKNWCKYSNNKGDPARIKAMFSAVVEFRDKEWKDTLEGKYRLEFVKKTITTFVGPEAAAERGKTKEEQAQKQVWDTIKTAVIHALQWACKEPKAKDGGQLGKVKDFDLWFKDHDKPKDPAWADPPKVVGGPK